MNAWMEHLAAIEDPRQPGKVEHRLIDILMIAVCAVIAGADSYEDIALYGRSKQRWLRRFLTLPNGIPSHDTFRRVLMLIDPDVFEAIVHGMGWLVHPEPGARGRRHRFGKLKAAPLQDRPRRHSRER